MTKRGNVVLLMVAAAVLLAVPYTAAAQDAPGLGVSDAQFTYDVNANVGVEGAYTGKSPAPVTTAADSPVQRVSALFSNQGAKAIRSVTWEYVAFEDAGLTKVRRVYSVRSKKSIRPGESVRLWKDGYRLDNSPYRKARVTRVEFEDGTTWQSTRAKT